MGTLSITCTLVSLTITLLSMHVRGQHNPNFAAGRTTIVHLFEWKWNDIAEECERYLGPNGFAGVQVSPPNDNVIVILGDVKRPWWERYQPVSYKLVTRSGNEEEFASMVRRCNAVDVRIYVDAVINHMSGYWPSFTPSTGNSFFDAGTQQYSDVPYSNLDFNNVRCPTASGNIEDYNNANQVRNCKLSGLNDLYQGDNYVRGKLVQFLNQLVGFGVAGFRLDASKHMWPGDIKGIVDRLQSLPTDQGFPANSRPFIFQEVIDLGGEAITAGEYVGNGRVTEFKYGAALGEVLRKVNNQQAKYLKNFGEGWGFLLNGNSLVFVDNHDNQRGHGAGGANILTFRTSKLYKIANAFMLAWPYGSTRIMSSYFWEQDIENGLDKNDWVGPPHDSNFNILPVTINPNNTCGNGWICEHRWRQITNMIKFRNAVEGTTQNDWWDNDGNQIAFCRGDKGFIAINNDNTPLTQTLQTCLAPGTYCDVISGNLENGACTGKSVVVNSGGTASINISNSDEDPIVAVHVNVR